MGGRMSRASKTSNQDSEKDSDVVSDIHPPLVPTTSTHPDAVLMNQNQNVTTVNTLQSTSNTSHYESDPRVQSHEQNGGTGLSGSDLGNRRQTLVPALSFSQLTEQISTPELDNQNSEEESNSDESNEQNLEAELTFQNSYLETSGQNSVLELNGQNALPELIPPNYLLPEGIIDSSSENCIDTGNTNSSFESTSAPVVSENANHTYELFIPAFPEAGRIDNMVSSENIAPQTVDNTDAPMMTEESVPVPEPFSISDVTDDDLLEFFESASSVDQTLQNVTSSGVELLHSSEIKILDDGASTSSSTNSLSSSDQLIVDIEEYNNRLPHSSMDLSDEDFDQMSDTSFESEILNDNMEELTESAEDMAFKSSLKELMDKMTAPEAGAVVSSDTQCCCLGSGEQTITENSIVADPVPRNCISAGEVCQRDTPQTSSDVNNKRKSDEDAQDESESKRLAMDTEVPTENDLEMTMVDAD